MSRPARLRVAMISGGLPADVRHLEHVAERVDLTVYRSNWMHHTAQAAPLRLPTGIRVRSLPPLVRAQRGQLAFRYRGLDRALDANRPDVVHVVSEPWGLLACQAAGWVRAHPRSRLVLHGCDTVWHHGSPAKRALRRLLLRRTLPFTDGWLAENDKALDLARHNGLRPGATLARVHTNPRDAELFRPPTPSERAAARAALGIEDGTVAVGMAGRLVPEKGVREFLTAADLLVGRGFLATFLVAGVGPLAAEVAARESAAIRMLGALPHPGGVLELLRALDVLACPSLTTPTWEDQGPRVVLEAMMCGCVPVGAPTGAIPAMLDGRGVVAASTSAEDLADAVRRAAEPAADPGYRRDLAAWTSARYSGEAVGDQLLNVWRSVVDRRPATPIATAA